MSLIHALSCLFLPGPGLDMLQQGISLYHRVDRRSLPYCTLSLVQASPITQWSAHKLWDQWEVLFLGYLWGSCKETSLHLAVDNILAPKCPPLPPQKPRAFIVLHTSEGCGFTYSINLYHNKQPKYKLLLLLQPLTRTINHFLGKQSIILKKAEPDIIFYKPSFSMAFLGMGIDGLKQNHTNRKSPHPITMTGHWQTAEHCQMKARYMSEYWVGFFCDSTMGT